MPRVMKSVIRPRLALPALFAAALLTIIGVHYTGSARAAQGAAPRAVSAAPAAQQPPALERFAVYGLPAGKATGNPVHVTFPAGTNLKHVHGGPTFVYVISGSLTIIESNGMTQTYSAGMFFSEGPGHIHTVVVPQSAEVFYLQFLPPDAEDTIPVQ